MTDDELTISIAKAKGYTKGSGPMDEASTKYGGFMWWHTPDGRKTSVLPNWTNNIADAWKLLEEAEKEAEQAVELTHTVAINKKWYCSIGARCKGSDTAPMAICLAYIAWKDGES